MQLSILLLLVLSFGNLYFVLEWLLNGVVLLLLHGPVSGHLDSTGKRSQVLLGRQLTLGNGDKMSMSTWYSVVPMLILRFLFSEQCSAYKIKWKEHCSLLILRFLLYLSLLYWCSLCEL
jgi:hypothetical protein